MSKEYPEISVITPAYNAALYIGQTIESVIAQTFNNWELILVDDGSTDNTAEVVKMYTDLDPRIKYYYQQNGRQGKARNYAISKAEGIYLAFLDADDLWVPDKLEKQLRVLKEQNCSLVYCSGYIFEGTTENRIKEIEILIGHQSGKPLLEYLLKGRSIPVLSVVVETSAVKSVGQFDEDFRVQNAEDYQLWIKLADAGFVFYGMSEKLFFYRVHQNQVTYSDTMAFKQSIWALSRLSLASIDKKRLLNIMNKRVNRYLIHEIEHLNMNKKKEIVSLYWYPLRQRIKYLICSVMLSLGDKLLIKTGYKFFDLKEQI